MWGLDSALVLVWIEPQLSVSVHLEPADCAHTDRNNEGQAGPQEVHFPPGCHI